MSFSRHTSRIYMDDFDVRGALTVLSRRMAVEPPTEATPYYVGAHLALNLINNHEDIRTQKDFLLLFDRQLEENGIEPIKEGTEE